MYCFFCGTENKDDNQYCIKCGKSLHPKSGGDEISVNTEKKRSTLILMTVFAITVLAGIAICLVIYNKHSTDDNIVEEAAVENVANIKGQSSEEQKEKSDDNKNDDTLKTTKDRKEIDAEEEIIPTPEEQKYIDEAEKYLVLDDPLSAAEVLTAAMEEDYYPAVNEKLKDIKKRTMDYLTVEEMHSLDSGDIRIDYIERQYENGRVVYEEDLVSSNGEEKQIATWTKHGVDKEGNKTIEQFDGNGNRYFVIERDEKNHKTIEHLNNLDGPVTMITYYNEFGKSTETQMFSDKGDLYETIESEYDSRGNLITKYYKKGDEVTHTSSYEYDKYDREISIMSDSIKQLENKKYEYNTSGYSVHKISTIKENVDRTNTILESVDDSEYNALGGLVRSKSVTTYEDKEYISESTYTHDYHYYSGKYEE